MSLSLVRRTQADRPLTVTVEVPDSRRCRVRAIGTLDARTAPRLASELDAQRAASRRYARLDLSGVRFIDEGGLGVIVDAHHRFLAERGTLIITGASGCVARLLARTGIGAALFTIDAAPDAAPPVAPRRLAPAPGAG
jgi:anti-anti-sigma factor